MRADRARVRAGPGASARPTRRECPLGLRTSMCTCLCSSWSRVGRAGCLCAVVGRPGALRAAVSGRGGQPRRGWSRVVGAGARRRGRVRDRAQGNVARHAGRGQDPEGQLRDRAGRLPVRDRGAAQGPPPQRGAVPGCAPPARPRTLCGACGEGRCQGLQAQPAASLPVAAFVRAPALVRAAPRLAAAARAGACTKQEPYILVTGARPPPWQAHRQLLPRLLPGVARCGGAPSATPRAGALSRLSGAQS